MGRFTSRNALGSLSLIQWQIEAVAKNKGGYIEENIYGLKTFSLSFSIMKGNKIFAYY